MIVQCAGDTSFFLPAPTTTTTSGQFEGSARVSRHKTASGQKYPNFPTSGTERGSSFSPVLLGADLASLLYKYCGSEGEGQQELAAPRQRC